MIAPSPFPSPPLQARGPSGLAARGEEKGEGLQSEIYNLIFEMK
jgi:hypothetical protein